MQTKSQSSKADFTAFTVPQLEAFINARSQVIDSIRAEMVEIQQVIADKNQHWLEVGRFEGMTPSQISEFKALAQGVSVSPEQVKPFDSACPQR